MLRFYFSAVASLVTPVAGKRKIKVVTIADKLQILESLSTRATQAVVAQWFI